MNNYKLKSNDELAFIIKDAQEAALAMRGTNAAAEAKYLDQINDACTEQYRRRQAKHLYEVEALTMLEDHTSLKVWANNRAQAARQVEAAGYAVMSVNMVG